MKPDDGGIDAQVEYGLDLVDPSRTIELSLRDFLYLHNALAELNRFFHQPTHYPTLSDVEEFLGDRKRGMYGVLHKCLYKKFDYRDVFPADIVEMIEEGKFENPIYPFYYHNSGSEE